MNNEKKHIIKFDILIIIAFFAISSSYFAMRNNALSMDEIWNFSSIFKIYNGNLIYKDFNIVQTPLFFYIGNVLFKILGANYLTFRIYNVLIITILYTLIYLLFRKLEVKNSIAFFFTFVLFILNKYIIICGANYNTLAIDFVFIGILLKISIKKTHLNSVLSGIIIFLIIFTKQNIGMLYILGIIIYDIYQVILKKKIKEVLGEFIIEITTLCICLGITFAYMHLRGNLNDFISYCLLGIAEFNKNYNSNSIFSVPIMINSMIVNFGLSVVFYLLFLDDTTGKKDKSDFLMTQGVVFLLTQYPIFNSYHILLSYMLIEVYWMYIIFELLRCHTKILRKEKLLKGINNFLIIISVAISIYSTCKYYSSLKETDYKIYYGANLDDESEQDIKLICNYIVEQKTQGFDVKILSSKAMIYTTPLKINNGKYDLALIGNMGKKGEAGLIEDISKLQNTFILIIKDEDKVFFQESKLARKYIMDNFEYNGEIGNFVIYKSK